MPRKITADNINNTFGADGALDASSIPYDAQETIEQRVQRVGLPDVSAADDANVLTAYYVTPAEFGDELDGSVSTSGIINTYTHLTADVTQGATSIPVAAVNTTSMVPGREIMLHQSQAYRDISKRFIYEFVKIASVDAPTGDGNPGTLFLETGLTNSYLSDSSGDKINNTITQVVTVPHYTTLTVNGAIVPKAWDGESGGILTFRAKTLDGASDLNIQGKGYRTIWQRTTDLNAHVTSEGPLGKWGLFPGSNYPGGPSEYYSQVKGLGNSNISTRVTGSLLTQGSTGTGNATPVTLHAPLIPTVNGQNFTMADIDTVLPFGVPGLTVDDYSSNVVQTQGNEGPGILYGFAETITGYTGTINAAGIRINNSTAGPGGLAILQTPADPGFTGTVSLAGASTLNGGIPAGSGGFETGAGANPVLKGFKKTTRKDIRQRTVRIDATATTALAAADANNEIRMDFAGAKTITIGETGDILDYPEGATTRIVNNGTGNVTFVPTGGVTINGDATTVHPNEAITLQKTGTNTYMFTRSGAPDVSVKAAYEANNDTNAFTDAEKTKLGTVATNADVTGSNAPQVHAASHTNGTDDIQSATNSQKGLATATQILQLEQSKHIVNNIVRVMEFDTATTDADPGAGKFRFNNANLNSATYMYVDQTQAAGFGVGAWNEFVVDGMVDYGAVIRMYEIDGGTNRVTLRVTGPAETASTYYKIPVSVKQSFTPSAGEKLAMTIYPAKYHPVELLIPVGDETTALTTGTAKYRFRAPKKFILQELRASVNTAPTGANLVIDVNISNSTNTILSTKLSIDDGELTSTTAATPPVFGSDPQIIFDDQEIFIDIDQVGSTVAGAGLKLWFLGIENPGA